MKSREVRLVTSVTGILVMFIIGISVLAGFMLLQIRIQRQKEGKFEEDKDRVGQWLTEREGIEKQLAAMQQDRDAARDALAKAQGKIQRLEKTLAIETGANDKIRAELKSHWAGLGTAKARITKVEGDLAQAKSKAAADAKALTAERDQIKGQLGQANKAKTDAAGKVTALTQALKTKTDAAAAAVAERDKAKGELQALANAKASAEAKANEQVKLLAAAAADAKKLNATIQQLAATKAELEKKLTALQEANGSLTKQVESEKAQAAKAVQAIAAAQKEIAALKAQKKALEAQIAELKKKIPPAKPAAKKPAPGPTTAQKK